MILIRSEIADAARCVASVVARDSARPERARASFAAASPSAITGAPMKRATIRTSHRGFERIVSRRRSTLAG
jgi:hypothetical protein